MSFSFTLFFFSPSGSQCLSVFVCFVFRSLVPGFHYGSHNTILSLSHTRPINSLLFHIFLRVTYFVTFYSWTCLNHNCITIFLSSAVSSTCYVYISQFFFSNPSRTFCFHSFLEIKYLNCFSYIYIYTLGRAYFSFPTGLHSSFTHQPYIPYFYVFINLTHFCFITCFRPLSPHTL